MHQAAPTHGKYALRTGRVLDKPVAVLEFSSVGGSLAHGDAGVEEIAPDDLVEDVDARVTTPAPPVIARLVRTTQAAESERTPPPVAPRAAVARSRGPSLLSMFATVTVLATLGALAGLGIRALARPPAPGASMAVVGGAAVAPGDREQKGSEPSRVSSPPAPPTLASPPPPDTAILAPPPRVAPATQMHARVAPQPPRTATLAPQVHRITPNAHAPHAKAKATPAARGAKKRSVDR